jgi:hypothetical protein
MRRLSMVVGLVLAVPGMWALEVVEAPQIGVGLAAIGVPEDLREKLQARVRGELASGALRDFAVRLSAAVDSRERQRVEALMTPAARAVMNDELVAHITAGDLLGPADGRVLVTVRTHDDGSRQLHFNWYHAEKRMLIGTALPVAGSEAGGFLLDR